MADQPNKNGISLKRSLESLYGDEELSDIQFEGTDGGVVPAFRCILAARSPVFRSLLFGNFSEAKREGTIRLGYTSNVLKSVVQFCLTDEAEILRVSPPQFSSVMELADAANYYELPELKQKAEDAVIAEIERQPEMACVFLQQAVNMSLGLIEEVARKAIRTKPTETLVEGGAFVNLSSSVLRSIVADGKVQATESTLFKVLVAWVEKAENAARCAEAKDLTKCLKLERISPSELTSLVEPSRLVSQDQLMKAYRAQATKAEEKYAMQYDRMRHLVPCHWEGFESSVACSSSEKFETIMLQTKFTMCTGVWNWSVNVEALCSTVTWIGVASVSHDLTAIQDNKDNWLGRQTGGWVCGSNGFACTQGKGQRDFPQFGAGSVISFTLDLTGRGTLHASVDGGDSFQLFSDMLDAFEEDQEVGFLPAVSLYSPGRVRFLGLEDVGTS